MAPNELFTIGVEGTLQSAKSTRPNYVKKESKQKKQKTLIQSDVSIEQLEAFDKYHKENEAFIEPIAEKKIEAEQQFNEELVILKELLANNIPNNEEVDAESLPNYNQVKEMWNVIAHNLRYHNNKARKVEPQVINSTAVAMLMVQLISSEFSKGLSKEKIDELQTSLRKNLLQIKPNAISC